MLDFYFYYFMGKISTKPVLKYPTIVYNAITENENLGE